MCILSICFAALACCCACKQLNNPENPADPKTEIKHALQDACCRVYLEEREDVVLRAKGEARIQHAAGVAVFLNAAGVISKGGEQENDFLYAIIAFDKCQENVPDALYLGGENGEETVKVEKIQMVTPELAVVTIDGGFALLGVEPIPLATGNIDGAPDNNYLVDLATIEPNRMASINVRRTEEVENNLENFAEKTFMRMLCIAGSVQLISIDQVYQMESEGPGEQKLYFAELRWYEGFFQIGL